jgi:hypothetical protein
LKVGNTFHPEYCKLDIADQNQEEDNSDPKNHPRTAETSMEQGKTTNLSDPKPSNLDQEHKPNPPKLNQSNLNQDENLHELPMKKGMEVGLTSPNSAQLVPYGTVQNVDANSKCLDGKPLSDFVEVLVNIILRESTLLPRAQGRIIKLGNAAAQCIPWPRQNVSLDIYMYLIFICKHYNSYYAYFSA